MSARPVRMTNPETGCSTEWPSQIDCAAHFSVTAQTVRRWLERSEGCAVELWRIAHAKRRARVVPFMGHRSIRQASIALGVPYTSLYRQARAA